MADPEDLLVDFVVRARREPLPPAVRERVGLSLLDAAALAVAARDHPVVGAVESLVDVSPTGPARVWSRPGAVRATDAAWLNAVAAHAHFHDDTDMVAWAHPGSLVTPGPVALAQGEGLPFEAALRGTAAGYAALTWLGAEEQVARAIVERGFRAGPTLGALAAAAAAAATLGLPAERTRSAIGIAADSAGALLEPVRAGAQDWRLQNATAAMRGTQAALLARAGVVGPPLPLTGARGFLTAFTGTVDVPTRWSAAPDLADVHRTWSKALPTLGDNIAVAIAARKLFDDVLAGRSGTIVEHVTVGMNAHFAAYPGTAFRGPFTTVDQAVASTRFAVATLLTHGRLRYADYPALLRDRAVLDLVDRIDIEAHAELDYVSGWVDARVDGGDVHRSAADVPRTVFFRDRPTARAAALDQTGPGAAAAVDRWFDWLDRDPTDGDRPFDDLLDGLQEAA